MNPITIQKINHLDAHDRLLHLRKKSDYVSQGCQECIDKRPLAFEKHPFYIFVHARTEDGGALKRLIWEPRLTKPEAQENSMLFMAFPKLGHDAVEVIWMIPSEELWPQYQQSLLTESKIVQESIDKFIKNKKALQAPDPREVSDSLKASIMEKVRLEYIENYSKICSKAPN